MLRLRYLGLHLTNFAKMLKIVILIFYVLFVFFYLKTTNTAIFYKIQLKTLDKN